MKNILYQLGNKFLLRTELTYNEVPANKSKGLQVYFYNKKHNNIK